MSTRTRPQHAAIEVRALPTRTKTKRRLRGFAPFLLVLAGLATLLYPVFATQHNNAEQTRLADMYTSSVEQTDTSIIEDQLRRAQEYNRTLADQPILDPWLESQRPDTPKYQDYLSQLDLDEVMGRVSIPKIHVSLPIYHGTTPDVLAKGVGHLFGTALPIGGASTHSVLTAHTGYGTATLFDRLTDLELGDPFYINTLGKTLKYEVVDIRVVLPTETESLNKVPGRDLTTLITCTPYGINTHRLLVTAERVAVDPDVASSEVSESMPAPMQSWMIIVLWIAGIVAALLLGALIRALVVARRRSRDDEPNTGAATTEELQLSPDETQI